MRGLKLFLNDGLFAVTRSWLPSRPAAPRTFHPPTFRQPFDHTVFSRLRMASTSAEGLKWPAKRVRETFLDFFKERNHTFGPLCPSVVSAALKLTRNF